MTTMTSPPRPETGQAPIRSEASKTKLTRRQRLSRLDVKASPYLYIAPFFVLFALIGLFPLVYTFVVSLNDWDILSGAGEWIGLDNYVAELNDPYFWNSLFNTMSIFLLSAIPQLVAAVFIAAVLDQNLRAKTFWRMSILIPYIVTPVAVAIIFSSAFGEKYGLINNILTSFNIEPVMWKSEVFASHFAIASMVNWRWTGYNALILLAAMQAVPRDIYESAATIGGLQIFTEPKLFNPTSANLGGAHREYQTTVLYLWDMAFNRGDFGKASAIAWLLFIIIVAFGLLNFAISRKIASTEVKVISKRRAKKLARYRATTAANPTGVPGVTAVDEEKRS